MKPKIFYINGIAKSGKDSFVDLAGEFIPIKKLSTITKVKYVAAESFGWNGKKDEKGRALLSSIKDAWTEYNDGPVNSIGKLLENDDWPYSAVFIMVREFQEMMKMQERFGGKTINVVRPGIEPGETEQSFLKMIPVNYDYDIVIMNDGCLGDLKEDAKNFAKYDVLL